MPVNDIAPNTTLAVTMLVTLIGTLAANIFAYLKSSRDREQDRADAQQTRDWLLADREVERADRAAVARKVDQVAVTAHTSGVRVSAKLDEMGVTLDTVHTLTNSAALSAVRLLSVANRNAADSKMALAVALRQVYLLEPTETNKAAINRAEADFSAADRVARESEESFRLKEKEQQSLNPAQ